MIKNSQPFKKIVRKPQGGGVFDSHCINRLKYHANAVATLNHIKLVLVHILEKIATTRLNPLVDHKIILFIVLHKRNIASVEISNALFILINTCR